MVYPQLCLLNPILKLRFWSGLFFKGSKHSPGNVLKPRKKKSAQLDLRCTPFCETSIEAHTTKNDKLVSDPDYYINFRNGFCVFQVENTLFNVRYNTPQILWINSIFLLQVHQIMLSREPSAFNDMLSLPQSAGDVEGREEKPVFLTDTAQQFRDFLWALYAP